MTNYELDQTRKTITTVSEAVCWVLFTAAVAFVALACGLSLLKYNGVI